MINEFVYQDTLEKIIIVKHQTNVEIIEINNLPKFIKIFKIITSEIFIVNLPETIIIMKIITPYNFISHESIIINKQSFITKKKIKTNIYCDNIENYCVINFYN